MTIPKPTTSKNRKKIASIFSHLFRGGADEVYELLNELSQKYVRVAPNPVVNGLPLVKSLKKLSEATILGESWTRVRKPFHIAPYYVVSNQGRVFSFYTAKLLNLTSAYKSLISPYAYELVLKTPKKYTAIERLKLTALNWVSPLPTDNDRELKLYSVINPKGGYENVNLDDLVFVRCLRRKSLKWKN